MERLTQRELYKRDNGKYESVLCNADVKSGMCNDNCKYGLCKWNEQALLKLKHHEDLEEKGRLIELPCKVGDTVYNITGGKLSEETVMAINIGINRNKGSMGIITENFRYANVLHENIDFGDTVFLTQSEAEQALAERQKNEDIKTT